MTVPLWNKIRKCFYISMKDSQQKSSKSDEREGNGFYRHTQRYVENIVVGGCDENRQIGENPNSKNKNNEAVIHPPQNLQLGSVFASILLSLLQALGFCHSFWLSDRSWLQQTERTVFSRF